MFFILAGTPQIKPANTLAYFASPEKFDPELQRFLEDASSKLCTWLGEATRRGPLPALSDLPDVAPKKSGLSWDLLLDDFQQIMDGAYQPSHPGAIAHLDPPPLTASIVADLICAGLNNNLLAEELSPGLTKLEREVCRWFADQLGLPPSAGGVAASGGTLSNLMALVLARNAANLGTDSNAVVLASQDAHVSLAKAIRVMGLGVESLELVSTNADGKMSIEALETHIALLKKQGRNCFAIVATAGTTVRGAIDPLEQIAAIAFRENIWLHIDGAIGGAFALSSSTKSLVHGIGLADSVTLNPQKVLGITKTSSLLLVAQKENLCTTFATGLPYIEPAWGDAHGGEMGLQGSRSAEILKLWIGLKQLGEDGIKQLLEGAIDRRVYLEERIDLSCFNLVSGPLHLVAFSPSNFDEHQSSQWSFSTRQTLLDNDLMLSRPVYRNRHYLKAVLGNPHTQITHLDELAKTINKSLSGFSI
ncbi:pyridoxal phosphate-dependent decarboxylase family protein [Prochlorococcus sp. MIT 1300]|uniref:pyridoxal phosphate-dependent decarboxylase family protein n=1 Tax=Prochlorococcus sp. MIT 1300 TaxID=3096218 RepID=UPI002A755A0D|nr:pyridoxal-dependent decarboxylase [Prochlorococcus sp. MIT 1300]